jgi:hypothetical protein
VGTNVNSFAILAGARATFRDRANVSGGDIGVAPGTGDSLIAGFDTKLALGRATLGQRLALSDRAALGDLFADTVVGPRATFTSRSPYIAPPSQPPIGSFTAGTAPLAVNTPRTLAAGSFGDVTVSSTLTLSGGTYQVRNLALGSNAVVQASAPSILRVAGRVTGADRVRLAAMGVQGPGALRISVAGANDSTGGVVLGTDATLNALIVSRASFSAGDRLVASGAIAARNVTAGFDAKITFATGFECNADAACDDANPCTSDACLDAQCTHSNVADGVACSDDGNACTNDVCNNGSCAHGSVTNGTPCASDDNPCTTDRCAAGLCAHPPVADGSACTSDSNECTSDSCTNGSCTHAAVADGTACVDDANGCTSDTCSAGACAHPASANGTACGAPGDVCAAGSCATSSCVSDSDGSGDTQGSSVTIRFAGKTVTRRDAISFAADGGIISKTEIRADDALVLRQSFVSSATHDTLTASIDYGAAFHGVSHIELVTDGTTTNGSIDGLALAPFPSASRDASLLQLADGSALPLISVDPGTQELVQAVNGSASSVPECTPTLASTPDSAAVLVLANVQPPILPSPGILSPHGAGTFAGCDDCQSGCRSQYLECLGLAALKCGAEVFPPIQAYCIADEVGHCDKQEDRCMNHCSDPGAACCPNRCFTGCCQASQTCIGQHFPALCCDAGFETCSGPLGEFCVDPAEATCLPSGVPCPNGTPICGSGTDAVCCPGVCNGDQCLPSADFGLELGGEVKETVDQFEICGKGHGFSPGGNVSLSFDPLPTGLPGPLLTFTAADDGSLSFDRNVSVAPHACLPDPNLEITVTATDLETGGTTTAPFNSKFFCSNGGSADFGGGCPKL